MDLMKELANKARLEEVDRWILRTAFQSQLIKNIKKMSRVLPLDILMFFFDVFLNINVIPPHEQGKHLDKVRELSDPDRRFKRFHTKGRN
jgi:hypothetical protein